MNATMSSVQPMGDAVPRRPVFALSAVLTAAGLAAFLAGLFGPQPERAWQAFLVNFLLWSAMAQGAVLFAAVHAASPGPLDRPAEWAVRGLCRLFPAVVCALPRPAARPEPPFPLLHEDLHGKEIWLNIPFLFTRDAFGLLILYGCGSPTCPRPQTQAPGPPAGRGPAAAGSPAGYRKPRRRSGASRAA